MTWSCVQVSVCMGIVCGHFTALVSDWVWGGLCGSESGAGQPAVPGHRQTGSVGLRACRVLDLLPPPPPP